MTLQKLQEMSASHLAVTQRLSEIALDNLISWDEFDAKVAEQQESHKSLVDALKQYVSENRD